ncbi:MAG: hypothetical protein EXQ70_10770 [Solirubrobacterales bacterium]|nr:hypothetical protein [Solirubrobacterales bacterium]
MKRIDFKKEIRFRRPSRPKLGGPSVSMPPALGDLVADLRERRLLPIAIVLLVGMIAVPIAIAASGGGSAPAPAADAAAAPINEESTPAVLAYDPGVRDYRQRLAGLSAKDPFAQQFQAPSVEASELTTTLDAGGASSPAASISTTDISGSGKATINEGGGGGGGGGSSDDETRYVSYTAVVDTGEAGVKLARREAGPFDFLPSPSVPVAVYLGAGGKGKTALFLVSSDVSDVSGDGVCTLGGASCDVLVLQAGDAADLTFAPDGKTYRIRVHAIRQVITSKPAG